MKDENPMKLIILRGLPASGKSTMAKELVAKYGNCVRINKDDLRAMLFGGAKWNPKREDTVVRLQTSLVCQALQNQQSVIVDDTNFNPKHVERWRSIANDGNHKFELIDVDVSVDECIRRDLNRTASVGPDVIRNMAWSAGLVKQEKPFVIFDLDGTLADITERRKLSIRDDGSMDWKKFFDPVNIKLDIPRKDIFKMAYDAKNAGNDIIICSGRSDATYWATRKWLMYAWGSLYSYEFTNEHQEFYSRLIMRSDSDHRPDTELKLWMLDKYLDVSKLQYIVDDRPSVIRSWRSCGLTVHDVGDGVEF